MSLCLRPVVETWGESLTYSSRGDIGEILVSLSIQAENKRGLKDEPIEQAVNSYTDLTVFYVSDGAAFLEYLEKTPVEAIMDGLASDGHASSNNEEYARQREDITDLCAMANSWRRSIDPHDGSLRIYCD